MVLQISSLCSKRFQSSYCAKVRAEAKSFLFLLSSQLSRRTRAEHATRRLQISGKEVRFLSQDSQ